jgi:PhnB protein
MELDPYLHFDGNCEEALNFYAHIFGGNIADLRHFEGSPLESQLPAGSGGKVMHARFVSPTLHFMASDGMAARGREGGRISLALATRDTHDAERVFNELAEGGKITHPFGDTFWGAKFGMLTDKFGIDWMINCDKA